MTFLGDIFKYFFKKAYGRFVKLFEQAHENGAPLSLGVFHDGVEVAVHRRGQVSLFEHPVASHDDRVTLYNLLQPKGQPDAMQQLHMNESWILLFNFLQAKEQKLST